MPKIKACSHCGVRTKRIYMREFTRCENKKYKSKYIPIGWYCPYCSEIMTDDNKKYIPFERYHILEFDYKQLQHNMDKISLEEE